MKLKNIPGENIAKLGETIVFTVKQIECSGHVSTDLTTLVSKPYLIIFILKEQIKGEYY